MQSSQRQDLSVILELGSVEQLKRLADKGYKPSSQPKVNSHIHLPPNFSAFQSVQQAVALAEEQSVRVLGVSNYYDFSVYDDFAEQARQRNVFPLFGLEIIALLNDLAEKAIRINDPSNPGKLYICGKGITCFAELTPRASELIAIIRRNDDKRMAAMIGRVDAIFASHGLQTHLDAKAVSRSVTRRHRCDSRTVTLQERHIAQAFQEAFFKRVEPQQRGEFLSRLFGSPSTTQPDDAVAIQGQIRSHLMKAGKPAFVQESFLNFPQAYGLILELGGIPCYPTLADGANPICEYETPVEKLIERLQENNIHMAELIPIRNKPSVLTSYASTMRQAGILLVSGTEHNTSELLPIEPKCVDGQDVSPEVAGLFWEGACIVAAHQFLTLHGQQGYVDQSGKLNPAYETVEQRIDEFAKLGAAVIQKYYDIQ